MTTKSAEERRLEISAAALLAYEETLVERLLPGVRLEMPTADDAAHAHEARRRRTVLALLFVDAGRRGADRVTWTEWHETLTTLDRALLAFVERRPEAILVLDPRALEMRRLAVQLRELVESEGDERRAVEERAATEGDPFLAALWNLPRLRGDRPTHRHIALRAAEYGLTHEDVAIVESVCRVVCETGPEPMFRLDRDDGFYFGDARDPFGGRGRIEIWRKNMANARAAAERKKRQTRRR
jgi:hypothetical protein